MIRLTDAQIASAALAWEPVVLKPLRQTVRVPGSVGPPDTAQATVGSIVEGRVVRVRVVAGDQVRAGDPLVEIHTHELSDAQAELTAARAERAYHAEAAARAERLYDARAVSLEELQRRRASLEGAVAEERRALEMVEHLHPTPEGNAGAMAPMDGVVFRVDAHPGQAVLPGDPLVLMGSMEVLWVTAFVPEGTPTTGLLEPGDLVSVVFETPTPAEVQARLVRIGQFVEPEHRSVEMRFELLDAPESVRVGAFAMVEVSSTHPFEGVELPESAAVRVGAEDVVFLTSGDGTFEPRVVTVRPLRGGYVAVDGLEPGMHVVTSGAYFLKSVLESAEAEGEGEAP